MTNLTVPYQKISYQVGDCPLTVLRGGNGEPALVLHGCRDAVGWTPFHDRLAQHFEVFAPFHPGFGGTPRPAAVETVEDLAYLYLDFVQEEVPAKTLLVGMDLGGWIALEMAVRCAHQLGGLVLIDSVGIKVSAPDRPDIRDLMTMEYDQALGLQWHDLQKARETLKHPHEMDDVELEVFLGNEEAEVLYAWKPFMHNPALKKWLHRVSVPVLVLWGVDDRVVSTDYGFALAKAIPGARVTLVDEAGHLPHLERPDHVVEAIVGFARGEVL